MRRCREAAAGGLLVLLLAAGCRTDEAGTSGGSSRPGGTPGCRPGVQATALRGVRRDIQVGSEMRSYLLDVPAGPTDEPRPVVLAFHGFRGAAGALRRWTGLGRAALRAGAIAAFPEGYDGVELRGFTGRGWNLEPPGQTRDVAFVRALLDALEREWCVDRRRVYATGMSNGGFFANLLGCELGDRLAGIAAVAGSKPLAGCTDARVLPVLLIHGGRDRVVDPALARGAAEWWRTTNGCTGTRREQHCTIGVGCRADVTYCEAGQGHIWPRPATRRIMTFFELHARP
ncbi:MAG TPA: PHB depolymerase family esterase [Candidatus Limnocylindria bacterium]|nr:PHB depolymerase family esterase [Candidatus Limnocylindria bacterium]